MWGPVVDWTGEGVRHKYNVLKRSLENYKGDGSALDVMRYFGGYEMVMAVGGMLRAAELKMIILVDGFIMTNCVLVASRLYPEMQSYCVFGHCGDEAGINGTGFLGGESIARSRATAGRRFRLGMRLPDTRLRRSHDQRDA